MIYTISSKESSNKLPYPSPVGINSLLLNFIDLNYEITSVHLTKMSRLLTPSAFQKVKNHVETQRREGKQLDIVDVLEAVKLKGDKLSFLLSMKGFIEPRTLTIASSSIVSPNILQLAISKLFINGSEKLGLMSSYLTDLQSIIAADFKAQIYMRAKSIKSSFQPPATIPGQKSVPVRIVYRSTNHTRW